jgi:hypothetical protein
MTAWLRVLGIVVLVLGVGAGAYAATSLAFDTAFAEIAAQYARHPDHPLFQAEYYAAAAKHYGLVAGAIGGVLGGLVFGSLLFGLATVVARQPSGDR